MSQENVEVVRRFFAAFNARDMEAVRETLDPDVVIRRELEGWPETGPFVGREAVMRQWERNREPWGDALTVAPISIIDAGDRVVARQIVHGVGRGPEVHAEYTTVSTLRNGRTFLIDYDLELRRSPRSRGAVGARRSRRLLSLRDTARAMSQENVEIVKASFEAWNAGDMDAWGNFLAPDVIWRVPQDWPEPGPYAGREAVLRQVQQQRETFDADTAEPISDFIHAADRVVVRAVWRGKGHGPESNMEVTCLYTVRKGRIIAFEFFWDHSEALEAVGLSEQDAHSDS